jgi:hypothetical protein
VIGVVCLAALAGLELVQRLVSADSRQRHNDVAGFIYAALGVIYAVLLALVVIAVWEEYQAASETVEQEAKSVAEIFWLAHGLPEPEGSHLQELARSYAREVVEATATCSSRWVSTSTVTRVLRVFSATDTVIVFLSPSAPGPQLLCALPDEAADGTATRPLRYAPIKSVPTHSGGVATTLAGNTPLVQPARRFIRSRRS